MSANTCELDHIPVRLHQNGRPILDTFYIDEEIYRRTKREHIETPFASITLADISVNRQGNPSTPLSLEDDVLYNCTQREGVDIPKYDQGYVVLKIKELLEDQTFRKDFTTEDNSHFLELHIKHRPIPCNYVHCVFELIFDGILVTWDNYKQTLDKCKELRNACRAAIAAMIIRREIRINIQ